MTDQHPITPPPELRRLWAQQAQRMDPCDPVAWQEHVANQAARWGADQELEWCVSYVDNNVSGNKARALRAARRPKPPSLAEEALNTLGKKLVRFADPEGYDTIRRALERLQHLEQESNDN